MLSKIPGYRGGLRRAGAAGVLLLMSLAGPLSAQDEITVTVYHVPENDACRPKGYTQSNAVGERVCDILSYEPDVRQWERNPRVPRQSFSLGSGDRSVFKLEQPLRGLIDLYTKNFRELDDTDHRAGVFVFDFGESLEAPVRLMRCCSSGEKLQKGSLNRERRWIAHQEAHWLHWFNQITWTLEVDGRTWSFGTQ